jgi:FkbM family methyltransferase
MEPPLPGTKAADAADILIDVLSLDRLISIVDIGANPIGGPPPYKSLLARGIGRLTGFEPQADALARLLERSGPHETYLPYAVGDGREHQLRLCRASGMASLLEPDPASLALFHGFPEWGQVIRTQPIATHRLDEIHEVEKIDYLKIDVQGSELSIFEGGRGKLGAAVAIHTEVSFVPLYHDQPVFGDIDRALRSLGFIPHSFAGINRRAIAPVLIDNDPYRGINQLLEADIVYMRDFRHPERMSDEQLKFMAAIAHCCYGSIDLAIHCLLQLARRSTIPDRAVAAFMDVVKGPLVQATAD